MSLKASYLFVSAGLLLVEFITIGSSSALAAANPAQVTTGQLGQSIISQNIINIIGGVRGFVLGFAALLGLLAFTGGLIAINKQANNTHNMQKGGGYGTPFIAIVVGVCLMNLWMTIDAVSFTAFGNEFSWVQKGVGTTASQYKTGQLTVLAAAMWLQVIGIFMVMHGLSLYSKVGESQEATIGKASAHFIGGVLLSNILITTNIITSFTGFKNPFALLGIA